MCTGNSVVFCSGTNTQGPLQTHSGGTRERSYLTTSHRPRPPPTDPAHLRPPWPSPGSWPPRTSRRSWPGRAAGPRSSVCSDARPHRRSGPPPACSARTLWPCLCTSTIFFFFTTFYTADRYWSYQVYEQDKCNYTANTDMFNTSKYAFRERSPPLWGFFKSYQCCCLLPKKAEMSSMMPNTHLSGAVVPVSLQHTHTAGLQTKAFDGWTRNNDWIALHQVGVWVCECAATTAAPDVGHERVHVLEQHRRDVSEDEGRRCPDDQGDGQEAHALLEPPHDGRVERVRPLDWPRPAENTITQLHTVLKISHKPLEIVSVL